MYTKRFFNDLGRGLQKPKQVFYQSRYKRIPDLSYFSLRWSWYWWRSPPTKNGGEPLRNNLSKKSCIIIFPWWCLPRLKTEETMQIFSNSDVVVSGSSKEGDRSNSTLSNNKSPKIQQTPLVVNLTKLRDHMESFVICWIIMIYWEINFLTESKPTGYKEHIPLSSHHSMQRLP